LEKKTCEDQTIHRIVQDYLQNCAAAFGGWSEVTPGEMSQLVNQKIALETVLRCQSALAAGEASLLDASGKPSHLWWLMSRFQSEFRAGQVALGLARPRITTRRPANMIGVERDSIQQILDEYSAAKKEVKPRVV
jgi:hypothetical protein